MAASIGGPFLFFAGEGEKDSGESEEQVIGDVELTGFDTSTKKFYEPAGDLGQVFNFNLTPQAVEHRWSKATKSSVNGFQIYRTSMLSGHGPQDPVGALTYHFNNGGRLKSIHFTGFVTDPSLISSFVTSRFGFTRADASGAVYRPSTFSGHSGEMTLKSSKEYQGQYQVELTVSR